MTTSTADDTERQAWADQAETRAESRSVGREPSPDLVATGKRWIALAVLLVLAGAAGGAWAGSLRPVEYTSEVRLSVGSTSLRTLSVPGYVAATQQLASSYARVVTTGSQQTDVLAGQLGVGAGELVSVESTPIAESNIVRIRVVATAPTTATQAADALGERLIAAVTAPNDEAKAAKRAMAEASRRLSRDQQSVSDATASLTAAVSRWQVLNPLAAEAGAAPGGPAVTSAKSSLTEARSRAALSQIEFEGRTSDYREQQAIDPSTTAVEVVRPAVVVEDSATASLQWGALAGGAVGAVLGAGVLALTMRRRARAAG